MTWLDQQEEQERRTLGRGKAWIANPRQFVEDVIQPKFITTQQYEGLEEVRKLMIPRLKRLFARDTGQTYTLTDEEQSYVNKFGLSIQSGQGTGKDAFLSWIIIWFTFNMKLAKVLCTAPTQQQLKTVLWSEIAKWLKGTPIEKDMVHQSDKLYLKAYGGKNWMATWKTVNRSANAEAQAETIQGQHEDRMLMAVDEASGVPDPVFRPIEGSMTSLANLAIVIFNPTLSYGYAIDTQTTDKDNWICLRWNAEDSELHRGTGHCERMLKKYGRDSSAYRIRILGLPPIADKETLIPHDWVQQAVGRETEISEDDLTCAGLDVAGQGNNNSVFVVGVGDQIQRIEVDTNHIRSEEVARWAFNLCHLWEVEHIAVDTNGIGKAVYEKLEDWGIHVVDCNVGREPEIDDQRFPRLRDELWWEVRTLFEGRRVSLPEPTTPDEQEKLQTLIGELTVIKYEGSYKGQMEVIKVEGKKEMIKRGLESPDSADALCLYYYAKRHYGKRFTPRRRRRVVERIPSAAI